MKGEVKNRISSINDKYSLKLLNFNYCCSFRSMDKRAQLAALLSYYDIDIVLGCESHIDQSFLSSEILPNSYKIIRKDRSLGGGGVFIGFKQSLELRIRHNTPCYKRISRNDMGQITKNINLCTYVLSIGHLMIILVLLSS